MLQIFFTAANAMLPIVLLILLGMLLKKLGVFTDSSLQVGNKLVFVLFLPASLFINVYNIDSFQDLRWDVIGYCAGVVLLIFLLGLATAVLTSRDITRRGVILQCTFRSNFAIIGLSLAAALGGDEAQAVAALVSAILVPLFNVLSVIALTVFDGSGHRHSLKEILWDIAKNPLIIGILLAFCCLWIRQLQRQYLGQVVFSLREQTPFLYTILNQLKACTTPVALIVLGGRFRFSAAKGIFKEIFVGTLWRTVLAPVLGVGIAMLLSRYTGWIRFGPMEYPAIIALFGSPVAVSSAIMAKQMGGDEQLATQYVVWTSIVAIFTLFGLICAMMAAGLLAM